MSYTINSGVGQWDKSADIEWRLKQMQDDMKFMWNRLANLEAARNEKVEPDAGEQAARYIDPYFRSVIEENAKLIEENDVLRYQYEAMKNETVRCKEQIERLREELRVSRQSTTILIESLDEEIERLRENAKQDAKFLSAYHRICQKHGIAPSSSDLIAAMEENK